MSGYHAKIYEGKWKDWSPELERHDKEVIKIADIEEGRSIKTILDEKGRIHRLDNSMFSPEDWVKIEIGAKIEVSLLTKVLKASVLK